MAGSEFGGLLVKGLMGIHLPTLNQIGRGPKATWDLHAVPNMVGVSLKEGWAVQSMRTILTSSQALDIKVLRMLMAAGYIGTAPRMLAQ